MSKTTVVKLLILAALVVGNGYVAKASAADAFEKCVYGKRYHESCSEYCAFGLMGCGGTCSPSDGCVYPE